MHFCHNFGRFLVIGNRFQEMLIQSLVGSVLEISVSGRPEQIKE